MNFKRGFFMDVFRVTRQNSLHKTFVPLSLLGFGPKHMYFLK